MRIEKYPVKGKSHAFRSVWLFALFLIFNSIFLISCKSPSDPPATSGSGILQGTVKAFAVASPISVSPVGIHVELQATQYTVVSDSLGNFKIDNIPAGVYNIIFWKSGFDSMIYPVHHLLGVGTDIINDAYLIAESNDSIIFKTVSPVFTVSVTKVEHIIDTTITILPGGGKDTSVKQIDTTIITYDTVSIPNKLITACQLSGNSLPNDIYVYGSLDSLFYPNAICTESENLTVDQWLTVHKNDTSFHTAFQSPQIKNGVFLDTLTADIKGRKPFSFEPGQVIYIFVCGHSSTNGLPPLDGEYKHFLTTPYGPQTVRYRFVVP